MKKSESNREAYILSIKRQSMESVGFETMPFGRAHLPCEQYHLYDHAARL